MDSANSSWHSYRRCVATIEKAIIGLNEAINDFIRLWSSSNSDQPKRREQPRDYQNKN